MSHMSGYAASIEASAGSAGPERLMKAEAASCCEGARSTSLLTYMGLYDRFCSKPLLRGEEKSRSQASTVSIAGFIEVRLAVLQILLSSLRSAGS